MIFYDVLSSKDGKKEDRVDEMRWDREREEE